MLAFWLAATALHASITIDGLRYFYLDDVQMVSMRYARNLAEGQGLVWNPGERVEGYANPGWVFVMAAIHLAGAPLATAALYVKAIAALCAAGVLASSLVLRRQIGPASLSGDVVLLLALAMTADVVYWAANGFETPLLTALFVWLLARVAREANTGSPSAITFLTAGSLAVIRSDAHLLVVAVVVTGVALAADPARARRTAIVAAVLPACHLLFRLTYYGDALPNTFYVLYGDPHVVWREGARYARAFVFDYWVVIALATAGAVVGRGARLWLLVPVAPAGCHAVIAGGDAYEHFRFFAPAVPVLLVLAVTAVETWSDRSTFRRTAGLAVFLTAAVVAGDTLGRWPIDAMRSWRGRPWQGVVVGRVIDRHARKSASIATADIGAVGYFSRRHVIDLAGRTDRTVARGPARPGADPAARKYDIEHSLASRPDFVLTTGPHDASRLGDIMFALSGVDPSIEIGPALLASPSFRRHYRGQPVPLAPLLERRAMYVRDSSSERASLSGWRFPEAVF